MTQSSSAARLPMVAAALSGVGLMASICAFSNAAHRGPGDGSCDGGPHHPLHSAGFHGRHATAVPRL